MILFLNVGLFDQVLGLQQNREFAKKYDRMEVFKYSLSSLAHLYKWSKVIIYFELGPEYAEREKELQEFIEKEFKDFKLILKNFRNKTPRQWRKTYELFDDNLIFYNCNHDHVFIDSNPKFFNEIVDDFNHNEELISIAWTHWPEYISFPWTKPKFTKEISDIKIHEKYISYKAFYDINSISIINKSTYYHWWFSYDLPELDFIRPDSFSDPIWHYGKFENHTVNVPFREIGKHFDGYQHSSWKYLNCFSPVLEIPDGFFEDNIVINYSPDYIAGMTNINPLNDELQIFSKYGSDFNMHKDFIPYFWKNKITEFTDNFSYDNSNLTDEILKSKYKKRVLNTWFGLPCENLELFINVKEKIKNCLDLI